MSRNIVYGLVFKNYNELLKAAGLKINRKSPKKVKGGLSEQLLRQKKER